MSVTFELIKSVFITFQDIWFTASVKPLWVRLSEQEVAEEPFDTSQSDNKSAVLIK